MPLDRWFRNELREEVRSVLLDPVALGRGIFDPREVEKIVDDHLNQKRDNAYKIWALLMLELWLSGIGRGTVLG